VGRNNFAEETSLNREISISTAGGAGRGGGGFD
jgi:hypothetical protein